MKSYEQKRVLETRPKRHISARIAPSTHTVANTHYDPQRNPHSPTAAYSEIRFKSYSKIFTVEEPMKNAIPLFRRIEQHISELL